MDRGHISTNRLIDRPGAEATAQTIAPEDGSGERASRMSDGEVVAMLNGLLEETRAVARVLARTAGTYSASPVGETLANIANAEAASCVTLWREIESRGAEASSVTGELYATALKRQSIFRRLPIVLDAERDIVRRICDILPHIGSFRLEARLWRILKTEERSIGHLLQLLQ